jgi:ubiquinone/menaquinone biosynthesis C-methylase UbiE
MAINDKQGLIAKIKELPSVALDIGCGPNKKIPGAIGVDVLDYEGVDIVGDVFEVLGAIPSASVDSVHSFHFFEHIEDLPRLLGEIARVLKGGGELEIVVPHFSNPYFYSDPTHKRFFGLYTFCYYASESLFSRKVPNYQHAIQFQLTAVDLGFKSSRPFYFRHAFKKVIGSVFNSCGYMKEFYEENLSQIFPCYEIKYQLRKK